MAPKNRIVAETAPSFTEGPKDANYPFFLNYQKLRELGFDIKFHDEGIGLIPVRGVDGPILDQEFVRRCHEIGISDGVIEDMHHQMELIYNRHVILKAVQ